MQPDLKEKASVYLRANSLPGGTCLHGELGVFRHCNVKLVEHSLTPSSAKRLRGRELEMVPTQQLDVRFFGPECPPEGQPVCEIIFDSHVVVSRKSMIARK